jgi:hypothetical protein
MNIQGIRRIAAALPAAAVPADRTHASLADRAGHLLFDSLALSLTRLAQPQDSDRGTAYRGNPGLGSRHDTLIS